MSGTCRVASGSSFSNYCDLLTARSSESPDLGGYVFLGEDGGVEGVLEYAALDRASADVARSLRSYCSPGDRVLLVLPPGLPFISAFFGCLRAGLIAVPVYPPTPNNTDGFDTFRSILRSSGARVMVATGAWLTRAAEAIERAPDLRGMTWLNVEALPPGEDFVAPVVRSETTALLQYTSGSTGTPRGVVISHGNLLSNSEHIHRRFRSSTGTRLVTWLPPYHDMGLVGGILQPLYASFPVIMMSPVTFLKRPLRWLKAISDHRGTTAGGPNFAYRLCVQRISEEEASTLDLSTWEVAYNGAEPVEVEVLNEFTRRFERSGFRGTSWLVCYGLAESTLMVTGPTAQEFPPVHSGPPPRPEGDAPRRERGLDDDTEFQRTRSPSSAIVSCGAAIDDHEVIIANLSEDRLCEDGEVGEILVKGPSVAQGYWDSPSETASTFDVSVAGRGPYLRTKDLAFKLGPNVYVCGRRSSLIIVRGKKYNAHELEQCAGIASPSFRVGGTAAFQVEGSTGPRLVIVQEVERKAIRTFDVAAERASVVHALASTFGVAADEVVFVRPSSIPRTTSGKVRRPACRALFERGQLELVTRGLDAPTPTAAAQPSPEPGP